MLAGKDTIAQLNYHRIGAGLPFHRAVVQRLIRELLSKVGSLILCNQLLQVGSMQDLEPLLLCAVLLWNSLVHYPVNNSQAPKAAP